MGSGMLLLLGLVAFSGGARADEGERDRTILLTVAAPEADAEQLAAVTRELLQRLQMTVALRRVERIDTRELRQALVGEPPYFARVWIAFSKTGKARLYLEQATRDRVLVRDVADDAHNPELVREELGHILQTAIEGLKAGEEIGAPRDEALKQVDDETAASAPQAPPSVSPAPPAAPQKPRSPRQHRVRFGPRYELVWLGDGGHFEDGPGAVLGALVPGSKRVGLELGGFFRRPLKVEGSAVGARLHSIAFDTLVSFEAWRGSGARFRLAAGVQADFVRVSAFSKAAADVQLAPSRWLTLALGRVALTYAHDVANFMDVEVTLGAELDPSGTRFVFQRSAGSEDVLSPWPVRPLLSLGATVP
jgi:hypothetical protein